MKFIEFGEKINGKLGKPFGTLVLVVSLISGQLSQVVAQSTSKRCNQFSLKNNTEKKINGIVKACNFTNQVVEYIRVGDYILAKSIVEHPIYKKLSNINFWLEKYSLLRHNDYTTIIIFKSKDFENKFVLLFFDKGELKLATFVSPGREGHFTPNRKFLIAKKEIVHYSKKHNGYPMPYSLYLGQGGYYLHIGKIDGYPKSHGCIRMDKVSGEYLFNIAKINTPVNFLGYKSIKID